MKLWTRHKYGDCEKISGCQGVRREGGMNRQHTERFQGSEATLYDTTMVGTCHYTCVQTRECEAPGENPNVKYGLWVIIMLQHSFISCYKCTTVMWEVHSGETCMCGDKDYTETFCTSCSNSQKLETLLKIRFINFLRWHVSRKRKHTNACGSAGWPGVCIKSHGPNRDMRQDGMSLPFWT